MLPAVSEVAARFTKALSLFGKCHNGYNSGILADEAIDQLGKTETHTMVVFLIDL